MKSAPLKPTQSKAQPRQADSVASSPTRDRIIEAVYVCLERYGVQKTTVEDVARAAGFSRQTVYKNFTSKDDLVTEVCLIEAAKMNAEIHQRVQCQTSLASKITESIMVVIRFGRENAYVRRLIEPLEVRSRLTDRSNPIHALQRQRWAPILQDAAASGELASDLDMDEVVSWLTLAQMALLVKFGASAEDDVELEHMIRRFVVAPLLVKA